MFKDFDSGKVLLSIIMSLSGGTLYTVYFLHGNQLSGLTTKVDDLSVAITNHDKTVDAALDSVNAKIDSVNDDIHQHDVAIALAEREIEQLKREPPLIERQVIEPTHSVPVPAPLPALGHAIQHLFSPPHHWRGRRP